MENDEMTNPYGEGVVSKSASIQPQDVTEEDLRKINKYTLRPVTAEEVFTFKTVIGDNETDDRNFEPFDLLAIKDMARLYPGKTVIKDHNRRSDNQIARVYDAYVETSERQTKAGEPFTRVVAKSYMLRTKRNEDFIREIEAGIKREVSTGVRPKRMICSICGTDNLKTYCPHWPGKEYDKDHGRAPCMMTINGVKEAYELSFVAVPAQPRAGTTKGYGAPEPAEEPEAGKGEKDTASEMAVRCRIYEAKAFAAKEKGECN